MIKLTHQSQLLILLMLPKFLVLKFISVTTFVVVLESQSIAFIASNKTKKHTQENNYGFVTLQQKVTEDEVLEDIFQHHTDKLNVFLDAGGNPDKFLHSAVNTGSRECVEIMLKRGANVNAIDISNDNVTPLMVAARHTYRVGSEMSEFLIKSGATVNARASRGSTPIMFAAWGTAVHYEDEYVKVVKLLIKNGAKVNVRNNMGSTPLKIARSGNWKKITAVLIKAGAKS